MYHKKRIPAAVLVAACTLLLGSAAVVVAWHYLNPPHGTVTYAVYKPKIGFYCGSAASGVS